MIDHRDWNLILMLDLRRFNHQNKSMKLETPCFWYQFLVYGVQNLDQLSGDQFLVPSARNIRCGMSEDHGTYSLLWVVCDQVLQ